MSDDEFPDLFDPKTGRPLVPTQWVVRVPDGSQFVLWDLPIKITSALAEDFKCDWSDVVDQPLKGTGILAMAVYRAACRHLNQEPEEDLTTRRMFDLFDRAPRDLPTVYEGGLPKAEDETPTV